MQRSQHDRAAQNLAELLITILVGGLDLQVVRCRDRHRRRSLVETRGFGVGRGELQQLGHLPSVARDIGFDFADRPTTVAGNSVLIDLGSGELLARH